MELSIIIPVYNKIRYLSGLLEQVLEQTFSDYECLLIDDGSTDGSGVVCDEYAAKDARFRVFHIPNGGVSHARNLGLTHASGRYVTFIDADDGIHPDYLWSLYRCAADSGAVFVIGNLQKYWVDRDAVEPLPMPYQGLMGMERILPEFARVQQQTGLYGFCVAKLIRRDLLDGVHFDPEIKLAEDLNFYLDVYPKLDSVYFESTCFYTYLQAAENSSMLDSDDRIDYFTQLNIQYKIVRFLTEQQAFCGENRQIMIERLYDYVYFTLFHGHISETHCNCERIRIMNLPPRIRNRRESMLRRTVLWLFEKKMDLVLAGFLRAYRHARRMKNSLTQRR